MAWITRWPFGHHMDPQGPKYPMGVYLDELRVMEIFEGSPAEKAAESWVDRPLCRERDSYVKFPKVWLFDSTGGKNMCHHSCMIVWCFMSFSGFGEIFLSLVGDGTELLICSNDARPAFWLGTFFTRWMVWRLRPKRTAEIMVKKYPPREFTQTNLYNTYICPTWN